ncbi:uncharacterized protein LOC129801221 [Phlebotomus papatasi]|uniref:uncharacterized protein LOC129801221 n=1 Tax=Phlebotomus papatasi TaxID=29031 RepID=UPI00248419D2|nr:uncharacterized protein LOC129801221 [Phlebotomus papatasi]
MLQEFREKNPNHKLLDVCEKGWGKGIQLAVFQNGAPSTISFSTTSSNNLGQFLQGFPAKFGNISVGSTGDDAGGGSASHLSSRQQQAARGTSNPPKLDIFFIDLLADIEQLMN